MHSVLPQAYLAPLAPLAMGYLQFVSHTQPYPTSFAEHQQHSLPPAPQMTPEEPYARTWNNNPDESSAAPTPLDLSLKAPATPPGKADECETIEVDDEEDRRSREEARSIHYHRSADWDADSMLVNLDDSSRSSADSYQQHHLLQQSLPYHAEKAGLSPPVYSDHMHSKLLLSPSSQVASYQHLLATPTHQPTQQQQQQHHHHHHHHHHLQGTHALTPPSTPSPPQCPSKRKEVGTPVTPMGPPAETQKSPRSKKKHVRKLKFDEDKSSPVSGTIILSVDEVGGECADIDPEFNIVEVTPEARAELAKIENKLGPYQCKLCRHLHEDAFQLAQHRCSRIVNIDYRCPECEKRFTCPANLASHRRWHKPKPNTTKRKLDSQEDNFRPPPTVVACNHCDLTFSKPALLRKHVANQHPKEYGKVSKLDIESNYNNNNVGEDESNKQLQSRRNVIVDVVAMDVA